MMTLYPTLSERLQRQGPAPKMTPANPQEQLEQFPTDWQLIEELTLFAFSLPHVVEAHTQIAPPGSRALTLSPADASKNRNAFMVDYEFAHIHNPPIGSLHLTLPDALIDLVLRKNWGLRHPLAVQGRVSPNIMFIFAPRTHYELETVKEILLQSYTFSSSH